MKATLVAAIILSICSGCSQGEGPTKSGSAALNLGLICKEIAEGVPEVASMTLAEFHTMAEGTGSEDPPTNKSLTYALLRLDYALPDREIKFEVDGMTPDNLKAQILRDGMATLIHSENVSRIDLRSIDQTKALGSVEFDVPRIVRGRFHFLARKGEVGPWRIHECVLLGRKQRVRISSSGKWSIDNLSEEECDYWRQVAVQPPLHQ